MKIIVCTVRKKSSGHVYELIHITGKVCCRSVTFSRQGNISPVKSELTTEGSWRFRQPSWGMEWVGSCFSPSLTGLQSVDVYTLRYIINFMMSCEQNFPENSDKCHSSKVCRIQHAHPSRLAIHMLVHSWL